MKVIQEFKEFALRGNVVDLAVGVIIGAAFGSIVSSLVADILTPPLGWLMGGLDFADKQILLTRKGETHLLTGRVLPADVAIRYGKFVNAMIAFIIQALAIFALVKVINMARRKQPAPASGPTMKDCPRCMISIPIKATRCGHCTSDLPA